MGHLLALKFLGFAASLLRKLRGKEWKTHPIDKLYGIETSRIVSKRELWTGSALDAANIGYGGVQPSVLRKCLEILPINKKWAFLDLGCGKGRALAVAFEYPFGEVIGLELSPLIYAKALKNGRKLIAHYPTRAFSIVLGDATRFEVPVSSSTAVLFIYNSFDDPLVCQTILHIERQLDARPDLKIIVIYYNPVWHQRFDDCSRLSRLFARKIDFTETECVVAPMGNTYDSVIIYQSNNGEIIPVMPGAGAAVRITIPRLGADVIS